MTSSASFTATALGFHEAAWGRDSSTPPFQPCLPAGREGLGVVTNEQEAKSYGHSYTLPENTNDARVLKRYLFGLRTKSPGACGVTESWLGA